MAINIINKNGGTIGDFSIVVGRLDLQTYATNGIAIAASDLGLTYMYDLLVGNSEGGYVFAYDPSAGKIKAFEAGADAAALDEVGATDLSGEPVSFVAIGRGYFVSDDL